jgi:ABC-2 type transport system ATP-binding protein
MTAVEAVALTRVYQQKARPDVTALAGLDLTVAEGEVHGLLGPNGAGKSTFMRILATVLLPTSGSARVLGHDVVHDHARVRRELAVVFGGERGLYPRLSARHNLRYWGALYRLDGRTAARRADELLTEMGLADRADDRVETYSTGMRQRLHLARGLIADPRVLLLDEPTNGLDPVAAHQLRGIIRGLADSGRTVLLATHDMAEAEAVCDRVTMISNGRVIATEAPRQLARWIATCERVDADGADEAVLARIKELPGVGEITSDGNGSVSIAVDGRETAGFVLQRLLDSGVTSVRTAMPSLEEVYLHLLREEAR